MPIITQQQAPEPVQSSTQVSTAETPMRVTVDSRPVNSKMRAFSLTAGQDADLDFIFQNDVGSPYDISVIPADCVFRAALLETVSGGKTLNPEVTIPVSVPDQQKGKLSIHLTSAQTRSPGVFRCSVALLNTLDSAIIQENTCFVYISASLSSNQGPPSILEIRLQLRDTSPTENLLLDGITFTDEEIALAVTRPISYFNEVHPDVGVYYTTSDFPFRYHWIEGIIAQLFRIVAEYYRKNQLQYNAGGLAVNDKNKEPNYMQAGDKHWATFAEFVKREKVRMNIEQGYAHVSSQYANWW